MKYFKHAFRNFSFLNLFVMVFTLIVCALTLYPIYYVFIMSISDTKEVIAMNIHFLPKGFTIESYKTLFFDKSLWTAYLNSIIYTVATTLLIICTSVLGAYPLTAKKFKGRKFIVGFLLVPMYFGGGLIPTYLLMSNIGLYDNRAAIIVPAMVSIWNIILVRSYFAGLPEGLRESAFIDGASHFQIMWQIYVPISKAILAVIAIYSIVGMWNNWFAAQVYLPNKDLHPLQMYLKRVLVQQSVDLTKLNFNQIEGAVAQARSATQLKYSMIIFTVLPIIFSYPFFQKYFVKGAVMGSLKE